MAIPVNVTSMSDLLFLAQRMPLSAETGDVRAWQILRRLATNYRIHLGCFYDQSKHARHIPMLAELCASVMCVPLLSQGDAVGALYVGNDEVKQLIKRRK